MWFIFGVLAIISTITNLFMYFNKRNYTLSMALGLSFTALTLTDWISGISQWVVTNDITALLDVVPTASKALWFLTMASILLNMVPVFLDLKNRKTPTIIE